MLPLRGESNLVKVLLLGIVLGGGGVGYLAVQIYSATPAAISPTSATIDAGQSVSITVAWQDGTSFPYSVYLYSSSNSTCTSGSTPVSAKSGLTTPSNTFSVQPGKTGYYCGLVVSTKGTSAISKSIKITVGPALEAPSVEVVPTDINQGQTASISANVSWSGGTGPFSVTLTSGFTSTCSSDITPAGSKLGVIGNSVSFPLPIPGSTTFYCATVKDSATVPASDTSPATKFTVNQALSASVTPASPTIDSGQPILLTAVPSHGTSPYNYQWYSGAGCTTIIAGKTSSTFQPGALGSTMTYSVKVTDSGKGDPASSACVSNTVKVNSAFSVIQVTISASPATGDAGQPVNVTVTWTSAGTVPYSAQLSTSSFSDCTGSKAAGLPVANLTVTSIVFKVKPNSTTIYCATITDSALVPESASTDLGAQVTVHAPLSATVTLSPSGIDTGQAATITATVTVPGGTTPYTITLFSGSSNTCSSDTTVVAVTLLTNPRTGVTAKTTTFTFVAPTVATKYCATVVDSADTPETASSPVVTFTINLALAAVINPSTPSIDSGQGITLTAAATKGTTPYNYQWSTGLVCGSAITGQTATTFASGVLTSSANYSVLVRDGSPGTPPASVCASVTVKVNPVLTVPTVSLSSPAIDAGQTAAITATVTWSGGSSPYQVTLTSGTNVLCSSDTTVVVTTPPPNPQTGLLTTTTTLSFTAPTATTYFCATVKDGSVTPVSVTSLSTKFTVNLAMTAPTSLLSPTVIDVGQTATVTATINWGGGTANYTVTLFSGLSSNCAVDTTVVIISANRPGGPITLSFPTPASSTFYCVNVKDSSVVQASLSSLTSLFTVNPVLTATITPSAPALDTGQAITLVLTAVTSQGTPAYSYQWHNGAVCASPIGGQTGSTYSTGTITSPTSYSVKVTDSSSGTPAAGVCASVSVAANPPLVLSLTVTPTALDTGQSTTLTASLSWTGGTSPYSVVLRSGFSST
ncbi:MAG: hypothetical protein HY297_01415, partial [Thaumarchaeota archaeon]|nr:hypothetical protein [Nitrososphaerota archaeon]